MWDLIVSIPVHCLSFHEIPNSQSQYKEILRFTTANLVDFPNSQDCHVFLNRYMYSTRYALLET